VLNAIKVLPLSTIKIKKYDYVSYFQHKNIAKSFVKLDLSLTLLL